MPPAQPLQRRTTALLARRQDADRGILQPRTRLIPGQLPRDEPAGPRGMKRPLAHNSDISRGTKVGSTPIRPSSTPHNRKLAAWIVEPVNSQPVRAKPTTRADKFSAPMVERSTMSQLRVCEPMDPAPFLHLTVLLLTHPYGSDQMEYVSHLPTSFTTLV